MRGRFCECAFTPVIIIVSWTFSLVLGCVINITCPSSTCVVMAGERSKHRLKFVGFRLFWDKNHVVSLSWFIEEKISSRNFLREKQYLGRNLNERRLEKSNTMESPQSGSQVSMSETASVAGTVSSESSVGRTPSVSATPESIPASTPAPVPQPKSQPPKRRGKGRYRTYKFVWTELRMFRISFCNFNVFSYLHFQEDSFAFFFNISSLSYTETIWFYQVDLISTVVMHQMTTKWQNSHIYSHKFNLNTWEYTRFIRSFIPC